MLFKEDGVAHLDLEDHCNLRVDFCEDYLSSPEAQRKLVRAALEAGWGDIKKVPAPHKGGSAWTGLRPRCLVGGHRYHKIPEFLDFTFAEI